MESHIGDIRDRQALLKVMRAFKPQILFHLAAQPLVRRSYDQPVETFETNVLGTVNVLEAARSVKSLRVIVNVTTDKVYENTGKRQGYNETDRLGGRDPYSNSKACSELVTTSYLHSFFAEHTGPKRVSVATARSGNVIGGGDWAEDRLIPDIARAYQSKQKVCIRNPESVRPWQHVLEPLNGYVQLAEHLWARSPGVEGAWNFGPSDRSAKSVSWILGQLSRWWPGHPGWCRDTRAHPHEEKRLTLKNTKARKALGWQSILPAFEALNWTLSWYQAYLEGQPASRLVEKQVIDYERKLNQKRSPYD